MSWSTDEARAGATGCRTRCPSSLSTRNWSTLSRPGPGEHELARDLLEVALRREPSGDAARGPTHRREDALADRRQHLLVAHVLDLVALEPAQRVAHVGALGDDRRHDRSHRASTAATDDTAIDDNGSTSDLDLHDLAEPEEAEDRHDRGDDHGHDPEGVLNSVVM